MSARHLKVRDPRHLLDSPPRVPDAAPPGTPCDSPPPASPVSVAAVVMANSVEGAALQPSRQPAASEVEVAAGKEERRPSEPVSKKRRLLQAQDESQDILAKVISEVGIDDDSNLVEGEMEEQPIPGPVEGVMGLPYTNDVRPPPPGLPLPPRLRVADPRMRPTFPYQTMEGPYVMRGLRPPYPHYAPRPIDLLAQQGPPPQYRPVYPPGPYQRLPPPPSQAIARLPLVRPSDRHLPPRHVSPSVPRHFRPPPLHTSPPGPPPLRQTHGVHHVFAAPSHRPLPGSSPESPTHLYPGPPVPRPELKDSHLREVYVPVLSLPGGPYANLHPRIPEGFTRVPFDPRAAPRREGAPHQMVVTSRLPPRPVYTSERLPGTEPALRPQPTGDDSWRPTRRVIEPPPPCVELIPLGPLRSSTATTSLSEDGRVSGLDNKPSGSSPPPEPRPQQVGVECRRQSAPAQNDQCSRPSLAQRSLSSGTPLGDTVKAAPLVEALQVDGRVVTNIITGDRVYKGRHVPFKRIKKTTKSSEEETRPSSSNNDATVEKEVCIDRDGGVVTPQSGLPAACDDTDSHLSQPTRTSRPASEPPPVTMAPPVTGRRPASVPAAGTTSVPCPRGEILEDAAFTERLQLVLNDLVSVPGATQLQELSRSPARLLSTVLRRWGVQPSTHPDLQKRLREDFKTMVKLCMPPTLLQDFGWESCTSEEILTQLIQLSQNGDLERPSSMTSSIPLDETLDDDVFSPSTPHSQPLHPSPSASQPSQPPPASQSSHPSSPASQPSQPPSPASQPSQPPPPVPKLSQTSPSASQSPQPPPLAPQSSQPSPLASQSSQPPSPALHPLQPQPPGPQPSRTLPSASHSSQPPSPASQSSQPQVPALKFSQPPSPASQPSQSPSPASQPPQPPPPASQSSQPPPPALQPSRSSPPALQPSQPPPPSPNPLSPTISLPPLSAPTSSPSSFSPPSLLTACLQTSSLSHSPLSSLSPLTLLPAAPVSSPSPPVPNL
ncbi:proline-rich protein 36-like isoform X2 [Portunus trituberculatus]|nr:proline-rich protein 36-like isoform X2 [Portunus trituberculatus]XP_045116529.1 proline-rich protein 36-like isoform X2 [Portunus trituberculatus]